MDFLARREHSEQELARKLSARGYAEDTVAETLAALVADRLLSNARFAEAFVHSRIQRGSGPQKIRAELRERGISDDLIDSSLDARADSWRELAREVRAKRFGSTRPADFRERSRQMRFLQQRGFSAGQIRDVFSDGDPDEDQAT
jgi:regulatory protein